MLLGNVTAVPPKLGDNVPFTSSPGWRAGREGGSPSPSWNVLASPGARDSASPPETRPCWGQGEESRRGKRLGGLGHNVGTGPQPLLTEIEEGIHFPPRGQKPQLCQVWELKMEGGLVLNT